MTDSYCAKTFSSNKPFTADFDVLSMIAAGIVSISVFFMLRVSVEMSLLIAMLLSLIIISSKRERP